MNVIDYITITCNLKNVRLQITSDYIKKCNRLQLITIINYDYPMSVCGMELPPPYLTFCLHIYIFNKNFFIFHLFFPPFFTCSCAYPYNLACVDFLLMNKGNNKITEQSYKGKVKTHKYINRQNQSTTGKLRVHHMQH
jgi:hypothetical protein